MRAMVLGAGLGTRLSPLTDILPKPAVPFFDRPLAAHALGMLAEVGVTDVVVNAHHLADRVEPALRPFVPPGMHLEVVHEPVLLGTGGGVKNALAHQTARLGPARSDEPILLVNGDVVFRPDLAAALRHHRAEKALATMVVRRDPRAAALGPIDVDAGGRARRILGRPALDGAFESMMFTGVHVLSGRALERLPGSGCIVRLGYVPWLTSGETIAAHVEAAPFRDCGTVAEYLAAHADVFDGVVSIAFERSGNGCVARTAHVEGAFLERTVVGDGAHVAPGVSLRDCVVWPGTEVRASAKDAVLAGDPCLVVQGPSRASR